MERGLLDVILYAGGYVMWFAGDALFRAKPRQRLPASARRRQALVAEAQQDRREHGPPELPAGTPRRKPRPELFEQQRGHAQRITKRKLQTSAATLGLWTAAVTGGRVLSSWEPLPRWGLSLAAGVAGGLLAWMHLRRAHARALGRETRQERDWGEAF